MTRRTLAVISAGLSQPSSTRLLADQLAAATRDELVRRGAEVELRVVDLREYAHDVMNNLLTGFPPAALRGALDAVTGADGIIAVTPIFNASYSGLFKSFFDVVESESLVDRPVLIGATGGTARHSLALEHAVRPMFSYLRAVVVPTTVFAAPEDWSGGTADGALRGRIRRAAGELADQVERRLPGSGPADPFALTTDFLQMLGRGDDDQVSPPGRTDERPAPGSARAGSPPG
ncbi:FMN reductase [Micromonospora sp. NPDC000668]|uniref:FMN reductase n=1 Tax=Micromonospora sp. NPDC000668 TaxID=3364219 RepID=UPI0036B992D4